MIRTLELAALAVTAVTACGGDDGGDPGEPGTVARVIDGDTIELTSGERVRYLMIDTPESTTETECYGVEAKAFNEDLVDQKDIVMRFDVERMDQFGRLLAYVSVDGVEINPVIVERGYACVLHISPNGDDRATEFEELELRARTLGRGLWAACDPRPC